ncbi:hypothetical protein F6U93_13950 [Tamlana haliotis]|uniref:Polysaccharide biosynthesis protein n=1 Tax=Pseudotamlana haliotis TaxID=2614804 RepID=A0A6N6MCT9_9FLAO|nr:hypothetical protein [Tamlana haliotis]KAB1066521.1 hypothetical protein F6U93_13950 [Tamlana haliotis]
MAKNIGFFLNSIKYIVVSGASKGFNYILLLYLAVGAFTEQYVIILLLLSLEQILSLLLPLNNPNIIYSKSISQYEVITNKLISNSLIVILLYLLLFVVFREFIYEYFEVNNLLVYLSIVVNILINSYLVYLTNYYKLIEKHQTALLIQALLLISFVSILVSVLIFDNKISSFFVGKAFGLTIVLVIITFLKLNLSKFSFTLLNTSELKKIINLLLVSVLGWVSGLGFMNVAKIYASDEELLKVGYILNICNVFLLISIGVNSVYNPLIKKYLNVNNIKALRIKRNTLLIYVLIAAISYLGYLLLMNFDFSGEIETMVSVIPYAILIFLFGAFQSVVHPFYLITDRFKDFSYLNILSYLFWIGLMLICTYYGYDNYIWFLVIIYMIKSGFAYFYAQKMFTGKMCSLKEAEQ